MKIHCERVTSFLGRRISIGRLPIPSRLTLAGRPPETEPDAAAAMDAALKLAGDRGFCASKRQTTLGDHGEVEKKLANSPRAFLWPEKARGEEATRGGGSFLR